MFSHKTQKTLYLYTLTHAHTEEEGTSFLAKERQYMTPSRVTVTP